MSTLGKLHTAWQRVRRQPEEKTKRGRGALPPHHSTHPWGYQDSPRRIYTCTQSIRWVTSGHTVLPLTNDTCANNIKFLKKARLCLCLDHEQCYNWIWNLNTSLRRAVGLQDFTAEVPKGRTDTQTSSCYSDDMHYTDAFSFRIARYIWLTSSEKQTLNLSGMCTQLLHKPIFADPHYWCSLHITMECL